MGGCGPDINMTPPWGCFLLLNQETAVWKASARYCPRPLQVSPTLGSPSSLHPLQIPQCWGGERMVAVEEGKGRVLPTHLLPTCCSLGGSALAATGGLASECHSLWLPG